MRPKNLRPCIVDDENKGFFHRWCHASELHAPSPLKGGLPGGVVEGELAIVELANSGKVVEVGPDRIRFTDV